MPSGSVVSKPPSASEADAPPFGQSRPNRLESAVTRNDDLAPRSLRGALVGDHDQERRRSGAEDRLTLAPGEHVEADDPPVELDRLLQVCDPERGPSDPDPLRERRGWRHPMGEGDGGNQPVGGYVLGTSWLSAGVRPSTVGYPPSQRSSSSSIDRRGALPHSNSASSLS